MEIYINIYSPSYLSKFSNESLVILLDNYIIWSPPDHDIVWKPLLHWPFVREIPLQRVDNVERWSLIYFLLLVCTSCWISSKRVRDLKCHDVDLTLRIGLFYTILILYAFAKVHCRGDAFSVTGGVANWWFDCHQRPNGYTAMASFTKQVNRRLAKRPLKTNGRLANRRLTSIAKEVTGRRPFRFNVRKTTIQTH